MINENSIYIEPNLNIYSDFQSAIDKKDIFIDNTFRRNSERTIHFEELNKFKRLFVIGEPGYGKSRLLYENHKFAGKDGDVSVFLNIRDVKDNLFSYIERELRRTKNSELSGFKIINTCNSIYSISNICLDGLDEAKSNQIKSRINEIKKLSIDFPNLRIIVSCRSHHLFRDDNYKLIEQENFKIIRIFPFDKDQIIEYIKYYSPHFEIRKLNNFFNKFPNAALNEYSGESVQWIPDESVHMIPAQSVQ